MALWSQIFLQILTGQVLFFGDFFAPPHQQSSGFGYFGSKPWPQGVVIVKFSEKVLPQDRQNFFKACREWTMNAKASCREATAQDTDFLSVEAEENVGCWTALGFHPNPDERAFNFNRACWDHYDLILHEVGHVLGLLHEHQRSDRDQFVEIHPENFQPGMEFAFTKNWAKDPLDSPYNVESIMHYPAFAYSKNSKPVIWARPGKPAVSLRNPKILTKQDLESVQRIYGVRNASKQDHKTSTD